MAAPSVIYRRGGGAVIPALISFIKGLNCKESLRINRTFVPIKAVYFLLWSGMVSLLPFLPVYMSYVGLNPVQVGIARGIEPFIGMFSSPLCGSLADKFSVHRFIMIGSIIGTGIIYGSGVFVALIDKNRTLNWTNVSHIPQGEKFRVLKRISFDEQEINCPSCQTIENQKIRLKSDSVSIYRVEKIHEMCHTENQSSEVTNLTPASDIFLSQRKGRTDNHSQQKVDINMETSGRKDTMLAFILMLVIVLTGQFVSNPAVPLLDATTMALVKECNDRGEKVEYGHQRLWGAIAWGLFAPLSGLAVDIYSSAYPDSFNKYLPAFAAFVVVVLLSVVPALCISLLPHRPPESLASNLGCLIRRPKVLVFLYAMFITGVSVGVISTYVFLFLAELSGSHTIMGLTLTLTCVAEVPFMFFATKLIERLGHRGVFVLTLFCYALRFVGYSLLQNPWLVLPIELLHGVTYGALWPACTSYINLITPDNMLTTMQSVTFGIKCGLGEGVGTLIGGIIYHLYGARNLFRGSAVLCMATVIFYWPVSVCLDRREAIRERRIQYEEI